MGGTTGIPPSPDPDPAEAHGSLPQPAQASRSARARRVRVLIWDGVEARRQRIAQELTPCTADILSLDRLQDVELTPGETVGVVLMALGASVAPNDPALRVIRALRDKGLCVWAYGDGLHSWPLVSRCQ